MLLIYLFGCVMCFTGQFQLLVSFSVGETDAASISEKCL